VGYILFFNQPSSTSCSPKPGKCGFGRKAGTEFDGVGNLGGFRSGTVTTPPGIPRGHGAWLLHPKIRTVVNVDDEIITSLATCGM